MYLARFISALAVGLSLGAHAEVQPDLCAVAPGSQPSLPARLLPGQGTTDMPVSTRNADAQAFFNQGVSQLHSFWTLEAERSFLQALEYDPNLAMAYWGIAVATGSDHISSFQLLRNRAQSVALAPAAPGAPIARTINGAAIDPKIRSREAIEKAMSLRNVVTPRERLYIEAQWARRNPASKSPDADYTTAMRKLVAAYPDDQEAKAFLGLVLLYGYESPTQTPRAGTLEGVRLLEEIVAKNDENFGAHHYLIHAYEGSKTPEKAWHSSEKYPQLVTNIPHALHMPGHIFAQSDRIDDAVNAFTVAGANELTYMNADALYPNGHYGHNIHFLIHTLNLQGRYAESLLQARNLLAFKETPKERNGENQRTTWRQGYFALIKTLVRFERWDEILDGRTIPVYDRPEQRAWRAWAVGLAQSVRGSVPDARASLATLQQAIASVKVKSPQLEAAALELQAAIEAREGNLAKSWATYRLAADREAALIYSEPPDYPRLVLEGWAKTALDAGDFKTAQNAYEEALRREPGSGRAYLGKYLALRGLGDEPGASRALQLARKAWHQADLQLPESRLLHVANAPLKTASAP